MFDSKNSDTMKLIINFQFYRIPILKTIESGLLYVIELSIKNNGFL